ncbi:MAG TPA: hypothetical protein VFG04_06325 [Planctomycetaceae bacterium]|nr:hypothetical protein [Planctomycetaceae bacterium]
MGPLFSLRSSLALILVAAAVCFRPQPMAAGGAEKAEVPVAKLLIYKIDLGVLNVPLDYLAKRLALRLGVPIRLDPEGLRRANVAASTRITASFKEVPVRVVLGEILRPLKLQARVVNGVIVIDDIKSSPGTAPQAEGDLAKLTDADKARGEQARTVDWPRGLRSFDREAASSLGPVLRVEAAFLNRICNPSAEQMQQLEQDRTKQLQAIAQELRGDQFDFDEPWRDLRPVARQFVQRNVAAWAHAHLSPVQANRYETETRKRNEKVRDVCARNLVAALDREVFLSENQRTKLTTALTRDWDPAWTPLVVHGEARVPAEFPRIRDTLIASDLDAAQQARWAELTKVEPASWGLPDDAFLGLHAELDAERGAKAVGKLALRVKVAPAPAPIRGLVAVPAEVVDTYIFDGFRNESAGREWQKAFVTLKGDELRRDLGLSDRQRKRLELAGLGDIEQFFRRVEAARPQRRMLSQAEIGALWQLNTQLQQGLFESGSLFQKALLTTLSPEQAARYEHSDRERRSYRNQAYIDMIVVQLDAILGLSDDQRTRLSQLLFDKTRALRESNQFRPRVVLAQMSRLPDDMLTPLFDAAQWRQLQRKLSHTRRELPALARMGIVFDGEQAGAKP